MHKFLEKGIYAAALTPLHADLTCNSQELACHCLDLITRGCKGVILFGTTGEGPSFSLQERLDALQEVIQYGVDPRKIILGNGGSTIPETVELARAGLLCNSPAILIAPPSFFKNVAEEGVAAFYREIIQRIGNPKLRIILYHIPQYSGVPITLKIIEILRQEFRDVVIGIKESEGNLPFTKQILETFSNFQVFVGNERHIIEAVHHGASGSICGMANLCPELLCSLYQQGQKNLCQNPQELEAFFEALNGYPFIAACKAWMEKKRGAAWHTLRPPLVPLDTEQSLSFAAKLLFL